MNSLGGKDGNLEVQTCRGKVGQASSGLRSIAVRENTNSVPSCVLIQSVHAAALRRSDILVLLRYSGILVLKSRDCSGLNVVIWHVLF